MISAWRNMKWIKKCVLADTMLSYFELISLFSLCDITCFIWLPHEMLHNICNQFKCGLNEKKKSTRNSTTFKSVDRIWKPPYVYAIKIHTPMSKVIWGQVVRAWKCKLLMWKVEVRSEPYVVYWYIMWEPSYVYEVRGHIPKSKGQVVRLKI